VNAGVETLFAVIASVRAWCAWRHSPRRTLSPILLETELEIRFIATAQAYDLEHRKLDRCGAPDAIRSEGTVT